MSKFKMIKFEVKLFYKDVQIAWLKFRTLRKESRLGIMKIKMAGKE